MENEKSFEELMEELDNLLKKLEDKEISLDESVKSYTKAMEISKKCYDILEKNEKLIVSKMTDMGLTNFEEE